MDIERKTKYSGKSYAFNDSHDPKYPVEHWFQNPPEGLTLFIVFYTLACRWSKCSGCNLPSKMSSKHIYFGHIMSPCKLWCFPASERGDSECVLSPFKIFNLLPVSFTTHRPVLVCSGLRRGRLSC